MLTLSLAERLLHPLGKDEKVERRESSKMDKRGA